MATVPACQGEKTASSRAMLLGFSTLRLNWEVGAGLSKPAQPPLSILSLCKKPEAQAWEIFFQCSLICHQDSLNVPSLNVPENLVKNADSGR